MCDLIPCAVNWKDFQTYWSNGYDTIKNGVSWHLNSKKIKKRSETHETLVDIMSCHQVDVVKFGMLDESLDTHPSQTVMVPRGNNACLMRNGR